MFDCSCAPLFRHSKRKRTLRNPTEITIRSRTEREAETWRTAILSCDPKADPNVISHRLVTKVLNEPIQPIIDEKVKEYVQSWTYGEEVDGYVDLTWCLKNNIHDSQNTRFYVTTTDNPPYDAVLGKKDAAQYGMLRSKK